VTIRVSVRPVSPGRATPQGSVTFTRQGNLLGSAALDANGRATFRTSVLPLGDHDIAIDYPGDEHFQRSSAVIGHRVV
jgi:Bacterial Ig-like domain (group 3)